MFSEQFDSRDLLNATILCRLACTTCMWFTISLCYFSPELAPKPFFVSDTALFWMVSWMCSFAVELPAYVVAALLMESPKSTFGRKGVTCGGLVLSGLMLLLHSFIDGSRGALFEYIFGFVWWLGRMATAASYLAIHPWTAELNPSNIRATSLGFNVFFACAGSAFSPIVAGIPTATSRAFLMSALCLLSAVVGFAFLPETRGHPMPNTLQDL